MSRVICGFPGVGKSYLFKRQEDYGVSLIDSDSSAFSWLENGARNSDFPQNYIEHIRKSVGIYDFVLVSSHSAVRKALREANIPYELVYPQASEKARYMNRYAARGSDKSFISSMLDNWEAFLADMAADDCPVHHVLPEGDYYLEWVLQQA